jgi:hypothetical protein
MLCYAEYKKQATVESISNIQHTCRHLLFNKKYKKNGIRILPSKKYMWGRTKEEAIEKAYLAYVQLENIIRSIA